MKSKMKNSVIVYSMLLLSLGAYLVSSKEHFKLEERLVRKPPTVSKYDCSECAYDDGVNRICLDHSVDLKLGWEFDQDWSIATGTTNYRYMLRAKPYTKASAVIHPIIKIDKIYTNEVTADLDDFKTYLYFELLYYDDYALCLNIGWATDPIVFNV